MDNEIVSFTTRQQRPGEINGVDYIFMNEETFDIHLENDGLVEWSKYGDNYYGIVKGEFERKLNKNNAFCIVDFNGMNQLFDIYPNTVTIFIYNSYEEAKLQMEQRGENEEFINKRLSTYIKELENSVHYDYKIKNIHGRLDDTIEIVRNIIETNIERED